MSWSSAAQRRRSASCLLNPMSDRDQVGERADPLAVTSCSAVVSVERGGEGEHSLGGLGGGDVGRGVGGVEGVGPPLQLTDGAGAQRDRETRRGLVGERQRELEQARERQQPTAQTFGDEDDGEGDETGQHPTDRAELLRSDPVRDGPRGCDRQDDRDERGRNAHRERGGVPRVPSVRRALIGVDLVRHRRSCRSPAVLDTAVAYEMSQMTYAGRLA